MEEKKKINPVIIILVVLLLSGVLGYIGYNEFIAKNNTTKENEKENNNKEETTEEKENNYNTDLTASQALDLVKEKHSDLKELLDINDYNSKTFKINAKKMENLIYTSLINSMILEYDGNYYILSSDKLNNIEVFSSISTTDVAKEDYEVLSYSDKTIVAKISHTEMGNTTPSSTYIFVLIKDSNNWKIAVF